MKNHLLALSQLDQQLRDWQRVNHRYGRPRAGWIKTIRKALGMTAEQLADRLGLSRVRIAKLENAETHDAVTLSTLRRTANAMGCDLVYALVPKNHSSLSSFIKNQAEQIATERVARIAHSMSLEAQTVDPDVLKKQKEELTKNLMGSLNKKLWLSVDNQRNNQKKNFFSQLKKNISPKKK